MRERSFGKSRKKELAGKCLNAEGSWKMPRSKRLKENHAENAVHESASRRRRTTNSQVRRRPTSLENTVTDK